ncbi:MAG: FAD-binding protein [Synergistaceae bacterium]|nr:FAD-binding protein [Synergistaceae bacterium]
MARVTVVGAGAAGLTAAIAARKAGAEVALVSKTAAGAASCTAYSAGLFSLACGGVTPEEQFEKLLRTGYGLNDRKLLRTLTEESCASLEEIASWGVTVAFKKGGASVRASARNELMGGGGMVEELLRIARGCGVKIIEWTAAREIFTIKNRAAGLSLTNWRAGKNYFLASDAVILATGGAGRIYSNTDNPERMTGDGYALALMAGLKLRDMEFVQFYPVGWAQPGFPMWMADASLGDYIRVTDAHGNEFLPEAYREWNVKNGRECNRTARDKLSILLAKKEGEGGVFAHVEETWPELWQDEGFLYALTLPPAFFKGLKSPLRIAPLEHYFCGGAEAGTSGETAVDGLYACGEVIGGIDGANRMGGNALTHTVTFGLRAGRAAAGQPREMPTEFAPREDIPGNSADGRPVSEVRAELQEKAWRAIGPIRRAAEIKDFLLYIEKLKKEKIKAESPHERLLALEMTGLAASAEAVASAALKRKESLGAHYII